MLRSGLFRRRCRVLAVWAAPTLAVWTSFIASLAAAELPTVVPGHLPAHQHLQSLPPRPRLTTTGGGLFPNTYAQPAPHADPSAENAHRRQPASSHGWTPPPVLSLPGATHAAGNARPATPSPAQPFAPPVLLMPPPQVGPPRIAQGGAAGFGTSGGFDGEGRPVVELPTIDLDRSLGMSVPPSVGEVGGRETGQVDGLGALRVGEPVQVPDQLVAPFAARIQQLPERESVPDDLPRLESTLPADFVPWWQPLVSQAMRSSAPVGASQPLTVDAATLVVSALQHSPSVEAIRLEPEIVRTALQEEDAAFDWTSFFETTYDDINEPVGNTLTTGGPDRFKDRNWNGNGGVRRRTRGGGEAELSQQLGWQTTNSRFFIPDQQGNSRLSLSFTQPLLAAGGQAYNASRIVLARIDAGRADNEAEERLQTHLLDVTAAYWELYRARAVYVQRRRVLTEAERILATLEGRQAIDAQRRQVLRARAAVTSRRTEIVRAVADIRNAEAELRRLVGDPDLLAGRSRELLPGEAPGSSYIPVSLAGSARTAMLRRPEIRAAIAQVRAAGVELGMADNELMPRLDLVFNTYVAGLRGEGDVFSSVGDSFDNGRPSFAAGVLFELPLGNRAAKARFRRQELRLVQRTRELEAVVERTLSDVEIAVREAETGYRELVSRYESLQAATTEAEYLADRWSLLPGSDRAATMLLEDLLDAQSRAADDEAALVQAQVDYLLALTDLRRSMGTLLQAAPACTGDRTAGLDVIDASMR